MRLGLPRASAALPAARRARLPGPGLRPTAFGVHRREPTSLPQTYTHPTLGKHPGKAQNHLPDARPPAAAQNGAPGALRAAGAPARRTTWGSKSQRRPAGAQPRARHRDAGAVRSVGFCFNQNMRGPARSVVQPMDLFYRQVTH